MLPRARGKVATLALAKRGMRVGGARLSLKSKRGKEEETGWGLDIPAPASRAVRRLRTCRCRAGWHMLAARTCSVSSSCPGLRNRVARTGHGPDTCACAPVPVDPRPAAGRSRGREGPGEGEGRTSGEETLGKEGPDSWAYETLRSPTDNRGDYLSHF